VLILLIHPDRCQREAIKQVLVDKSFDVTTVGDVAEGIEQFHRQEPEIVVIAHEPEVIDAEQFCILLRRESDVPIIAIGHNRGEVTLLQILRSGGDAYLRHPSTKEIVARVRSLLRRTKAKKDKDNGKTESRFTRLHKHLLLHIIPSKLSISRLGTLPGHFISRSVEPVCVMVKACWMTGPGYSDREIPGSIIRHHAVDKSGPGLLKTCSMLSGSPGTPGEMTSLGAGVVRGAGRSRVLRSPYWNYSSYRAGNPHPLNII